MDESKELELDDLSRPPGDPLPDRLRSESDSEFIARLTPKHWERVSWVAQAMGHADPRFTALYYNHNVV